MLGSGGLEGSPCKIPARPPPPLQLSEVSFQPSCPALSEWQLPAKELRPVGVVPCYPHRKSGRVPAISAKGLCWVDGAGVPPPHRHGLSKARAEGPGPRGESSDQSRESKRVPPFGRKAYLRCLPRRDLLTRSHPAAPLQISPRNAPLIFVASFVHVLTHSPCSYSLDR